MLWKVRINGRVKLALVGILALGLLYAPFLPVFPSKQILTVSKCNIYLRNQSVVTANGRVPLDNDSEENILPVQGETEGIMKTTQVSIRADETPLGKRRSPEDRI